MKFDYTHGKPARYLVMATWWNGRDMYYFSAYRDAINLYKALQANGNYHNDTVISVYDIVKDVRKEFSRITTCK